MRHAYVRGRAKHRSRLDGFTLVELLVVIGIIALLIGILLPALNRAREKGRAVQCMSNMRQIAMAMVSCANDHKGNMPASGGNDPYSYDHMTGAVDRTVVVAIKYSQPFDDDSNNDAIKHSRADWITWSRSRDPITGTPNTAPNENITYSALAPYLGAKHKLTPPGNFNAANAANPTLEAVYRCPSDNIEQRNSFQDSSHGFYRYSYAMNVLYAGGKWVGSAWPNQTGTGSLNFGKGQRVDGRFTGKISSIRNASQKILLICQDERVIDDGSFSPNPYNWKPDNGTNICEVLAARHDRKGAKANSRLSNAGWGSSPGNEDVMGNVGFCDGHVGTLGRREALRGRFTGNPNPDPDAAHGFGQ